MYGYQPSLALANRHADWRFETRRNVKPLYRELETQYILIPFDGTEEYSSLVQIKVSQDTERTAHDAQSTRFENLSVTGSPAKATWTAPGGGVPLVGRYITVWLYLDDVNQITSLVLRLIQSDGSAWGIEMVASELVSGPQQIDLHLDQFTPTGTPNVNNLVTQILVQLNPKIGAKTGFTLNRLMSVKRRPYIVFVNDGTYLEFTEDVVPLLAAKNLPYNIQLRDLEINEWYATGNPGITNTEDLVGAKDLLASGLCQYGLHIDSINYVNDAEFQAAFLSHYRKSAELGLIRYPVHISWLTNNAVSQTRKDYVDALMSGSRRCEGVAYKSHTRPAGDRLHYPMPHPRFYLSDIPYNEFTENTTVSAMETWFNNAISQELGLYVFGHGTTRLGRTPRAPLETYQAFLDLYEAHKLQIDWLSYSEFYERSYRSRVDPFVRKSLYAN